MIKYLVNISIMFGITFAYNYSVGEFISEEHQSVVKSTCYEGNGYGVGDDWKLADFNGATNGGHYNVVFIDMAATW